MARNEEKNYTILNRLYLEKLKEKYDRWHPKRPALGTLSTAADVIRWIPEIKTDINWCLHHLSGVRNYPDYKMNEFNERLDKLQVEYKKWVKRALELDPEQALIGTPGDPHKYVSRRQLEEIKRAKKARLQSNVSFYKDYYGDDVSGAEEGDQLLEFEAQLAEYTSRHPELLDFDIDTPLAKRPDGSLYDEDDEGIPEEDFDDPNNPANKPLSFAPKKIDKPPPASASQVSIKRKNEEEQDGKPNSSNKKVASALSSLVAYGSDSDKE